VPMQTLSNKIETPCVGSPNVHMAERNQAGSPKGRKN